MLDLFITNHLDKIGPLHQTHIPITDHELIFVSYNIRTEPLISKIIEFPNYLRINHTLLDNFLLNYDWSLLYNSQDCIIKVHIPNNLITDSLNQFVPIQKKIINSNDKPWFNQKIKRPIFLRNQAYNTWKRNRLNFNNINFDHNWEIFVGLRNIVKSLIKQSKKKFGFTIFFG